MLLDSYWNITLQKSAIQWSTHSHLLGKLFSKKKKVDKDLEKLEPVCNADGNVK